MKTFHGGEPSSSEVANITRRLGLAAYEPMGVAAIRLHRTDYIGHEIDRFFRATKTALPGIVTVGETMIREMQLALVPVAEGVCAVRGANGGPFNAGFPSDPIYCCVSPPDKWKGIGYNYPTYGLFAPRSLKRLYVHMDADRLNGIPPVAYDNTAERIPKGVVDKLAAAIVARQNLPKE